jgi:6-pyruvoyltetrahydropterin/6-carboxytetrahydropterin synthase
MLITRKVEFSASHLCRVAGLSDSENEALYGPEGNLHGHNFALEVTLEGEPDPVTGMVMDLKELKEILQRCVLDRYDHRFLNREAPPFDRVVPTAENIAVDIWRRLEERVSGPGRKLRQVRVYETPELWVDYRGGAA